MLVHVAIIFPYWDSHEKVCSQFTYYYIETY